MIRYWINAFSVVCILAITIAAQNSNTTATRQRTTNKTTEKTSQQKPASTASPDEAGKSNTVQTGKSSTTPTAKSTKPRSSAAAAAVKDPTSRGVTAAFNALLDGIRHSNVEEVTAEYWNSPELLLFNSNGTVTRGWERMRSNRESSYPNIKDVKLECRDLKVKMLGRDGAVGTCLWTQSQTVKGVPETASGRMTLVFGRVGDSWKVVHLHTSPDAPDPSRVLSTDPEKTPEKKP
jgi:ketosteroid isomerase-like protein